MYGMGTIWDDIIADLEQSGSEYAAAQALTDKEQLVGLATDPTGQEAAAASGITEAVTKGAMESVSETKGWAGEEGAVQNGAGGSSSYLPWIAVGGAVLLGVGGLLWYSSRSRSRGA
jgi:hypothetical protein